jgi:hypothetical protein
MMNEMKSDFPINSNFNHSSGKTLLNTSKPMFVLSAVASVFAIMLMALTTNSVASEKEKLTRGTPTIEVLPASADAGVARTIILDTQWPNSCIPTIAVVDDEFVAPLGILVVRPIGAISNAVCSPVLTRYRLEAGYTPKQTKGVIKVFLQQSETLVYGPALLTIDSPFAKKHSPYNVTGVYYDSRFSGSGITLIHNRGETDAVFGTWYVYDNEGKPRWYSIQSTEWKGADGNSFSMDILEGKLYETAANPCAANISACPAVLSGLKIVGTVRFSFITFYIGVGQIARAEAFSLDGRPLFVSELLRLLP